MFNGKKSRVIDKQNERKQSLETVFNKSTSLQMGLYNLKPLTIHHVGLKMADFQNRSILVPNVKRRLGLTFKVLSEVLFMSQPFR